MTSYRIEENADGVAVFGPLPIEDMIALSAAWQKRGLVILDAGIASAIGATLVVGAANGLKRWRKRLDDANAGHGPEARWLLGADTGTSSLTIFAVLTADETLRQAAVRRRGAPSTPLDDDDFGRCSRLLAAIPGWLERLGEVADRHAEWRPLVEIWAELEALHKARRSKALYERMAGVAR